MFSQKTLKVLNTHVPVFIRCIQSPIENGVKKQFSTSIRCAQHVSDFRSDTLSQPTKEMREAMFNATVGDDSYKEDPTVNELEHRMAQLTAKEASLFVSSGTMGNLIAAMVHCSKRNSEMILGDDSHIHVTEQGGIAQVAGIHSRQFKNKPDGSFDLDEVKDKIRERNNMNFPTTSLISVENTHNRCGGTVLPLPFLSKAFEFSKSMDIPFHIDGARVSNAAVHLKVPLSEITQYCDSVSMCFSKGLCAPMGSILCGSKDFIEQ
ncbi:putative low-specificity L-threonine aldolase 2 [Nymphon striatum]|nr:putative low-specificity L-threonine aldolase 2 [Nymphon striatum]